jgi:hypothetical protein
MDGVGGLEGWRWIFILEGLVTVVVAVFAFWGLYDFPDTASFLTEEERQFVIYRLKFQCQGRPLGGQEATRIKVPEAEEFEWKYVLQAFKDWQIWLNLLVCYGVNLSAIANITLFCMSGSNVSFLYRSCARSTASAYSCLPLSGAWAIPLARRSL